MTVLFLGTVYPSAKHVGALVPTNGSADTTKRFDLTRFLSSSRPSYAAAFSNSELDVVIREDMQCEADDSGERDKQGCVGD
jgi:hypothetical protein